MATEKVYEQASEVMYKLPLNSYKVSLLDVYAPCSPTKCRITEGSPVKEHSASNIPDDHRHSVGNTRRHGKLNFPLTSPEGLVYNHIHSWSLKTQTSKKKIKELERLGFILNN